MKRLEDFDNEYLFVLPKTFIKTLVTAPITSNLYVTNLGFFPNAEYHYVSREHGAEEWIIIFCTGGSGSATINHKCYQLHKYSLIILPPGVQQVYQASRSNPWDIYWVHFTGKLATEYPNVFTNKPFYINQISNAEVTNVMRYFWLMIKTYIPGFTYHRSLYTSQLLGLMLVELSLNSTHDKPQIQGSPYVDAAVNFIYDNIDTPIRLTTVANHLKISTSYLSRVFKAVTGNSINEYTTKLKMERATYYLDYTNITIQQIATRLGYADSYYFSRVFKREYSVSPKHYRNRKA
ncbi:AraC family transcriptional regulator [Lactiplantibacillus pentosus]|jgi:AraC-like DNA-binding protein|uniref:AraC family transcriptional regulator n=1 Tax=Lactiplantibacillus pentosus TaxID=1589 RepID=UPI000D015AA1|nr:AraC family transcriptional regulator [Lactiplantibacillus pentosus]MCT3064957.1 AraC family transcriptional regulator [Lactiplantibacillus pentosus]PRO93132.1 AraC family transcriptional regulator [Lactiplantibacillus pentosus]USJ86112.1 AraC family transcriptional regulator [Lactiplantibacillus pentosus]GIP69851.1 AraC family transcriptional regulator [Lactiplantibacillus pentosus]